MLEYMIPLIASFLKPSFLAFWFTPVLCLCVLSSILCVIRHLIFKR